GSEHHRSLLLDDQVNVRRSKRIMGDANARLVVLGYLAETAPTGAERVGGETWGNSAEVSEDAGTRRGNGRRIGESVGRRSRRSRDRSRAQRGRCTRRPGSWPERQASSGARFEQACFRSCATSRSTATRQLRRQ